MPQELETTQTPTTSFDDTLRSEISAAYARDEQGRFASRTAEDAPETEAPAVDGELEIEIEAGAEPAEQPIEAPASWSADARTIWDSLSREAQQELLRREDESSKATEQSAGKLRVLDEIHEAVSPMQQRLALSGRTVPQYLRQLTAVDDWLHREPVAALQYLAQACGVDLGQLGSQQQPQNTTPDPHTATQRTLAALQQEIQALKQAPLLSQVEAFSQQKDKYPHFDRLRPKMAALIGAGASNTLEDAYEAAVWADPDLRKSVLAEQQKAEAAQRTAAASKRVEQAKRAASINVDPGSPTAPARGSLQDTLRAVTKDVMSRAH